MKKTMIGLVALLSGSALTATAGGYSPWGHITRLVGGYGDPHLTILMDFPIYNPDGCSNNTQYIVAADLPASQQLTAMALTAFSADYKVRLVVEGCYLDRPNVIGLEIEK